jgi:tRNA pseudouridine55 synthase
MTSQNVVSYVKRVVKADKAGHTGTLDPCAAGVLPVCLGRATRISEYLLNDRKSYRAEMKIGYRSTTLDRYGEVEELGIPAVEDEIIYKTFEKFKGRIEQIPPMFSALKKDGVRLYNLARQGIVIKREARETFIYDISVINIKDNTILFDVLCSKGTYIRSLCSDIGKSLGSDAIMTFLLRTGTGPFKIRNAITLDELRIKVENDSISNVLYPIEAGLYNYDRIFVDDFTAKKVLNGVAFDVKSILKHETMVYNDILLIFDSNGSFLAIGRENGGYIKIDKVFA